MNNIGSNHRRTTNQDIYASKRDAEEMTDGWFVSAMPDLNQRNPFMAKYIIQNSIWWIETLRLGGIRQDTYPYPDKDFMSDWAGAIMMNIQILVLLVKSGVTIRYCWLLAKRA